MAPHPSSVSSRPQCTPKCWLFPWPWKAALNPNPTVPALPPLSAERACNASRFGHSWAKRVFPLGSAWTAKELLEQSQEGCYSGMLAHMAGGYHTGSPPGLQPYTTPDGLCLATRQHTATPREEEGGPNTHQYTDLHRTSIIPRQLPCFKRSSLPGTSSSLSLHQCQGSRAESWGHKRLLGTLCAGVSWKPYQALQIWQTSSGSSVPGGCYGSAGSTASAFLKDVICCHCRTLNPPSQCWRGSLKVNFSTSPDLPFCGATRHCSGHQKGMED